MLLNTSSSLIYDRLRHCAMRKNIRSTHLELETLPLLQRQAVALRNHRNNVNHLAQLLHDNDVDRSQSMASWVDEVQATVNAGILDVSFAHGSQLLAKVCTMLVLDVLDDRIPAAQKKIAITN